jgi:TonB family protein
MLLPRQRERWAWRRGALAMLLALCGHGLLLALLIFVSALAFDDKPHKPVSRPVVLRGLSPEAWQQNRGDLKAPQRDDKARTAAAKETKKPEVKKPEVVPQGQVVATAPGNQKVPEKSDYVAESNNTVDKQTRAREQTPFYRNAMPQRTAQKPTQGEGDGDKAQMAGNDGKALDDRPLKDTALPQKAMLEIPKAEAKTEIALKSNDVGPGANVKNRAEEEAIAGNSDRLKVQPGAAGATGEASQGHLGQPGVANMLPSAAVLERIIGAAPNDHLRDVEEGEGTFLNTKEWKYASFFNRVKQTVSQHWNPNAELRLRDPTGNIYSGRDRYTLLNVTLNDRGQLKQVYVEKSSGVDFLDLEAIKSFERSQPFLNPPPGLIDSDAQVRFSFGFFLDMGGGPRMRLFRSTN